jgi:ClpP class serine protease
MTVHNHACFMSHMGIYLCLPDFVRTAHAAIMANRDATVGPSHPIASAAAGVPVYAPGDDPEYTRPLYIRTDDGIACIEMVGAMAKSAGKYAQVGTVRVRQALRAAVADPESMAILMCADSPGGTVAGTQQLADEVRSADLQKPTYGHVEDLCASAAFWTLSQTRRMTANQSALVGSLGTYAVVYDTSEAAKMDGVKVHVLSTGPQKGAFVDGAEIRPEQLAEAQRTVDGLNALFKAGVMTGRKMTQAAADSLFDGRVHIASEARGLGLIDAVQSFDATLAQIASECAPKRETSNQRRMQLAAKRTP